MKPQRTANERIVADRLMWGNLFGSSILMREMADNAREDYLNGEPEELIRLRIRSRAESEGVAGPRMLFPAFTRKLLRVRLRPLLHACVDVLLARSKARRVNDFAKWLSDALGWDKWLEDYLYGYATTGEPGQIYEGFTGVVKRADIGPEGEKVPTVVLIATPATDTVAYVEQFKELCLAAFPDCTFSKRSDAIEEGARYFRLNQQGIPYSKIAFDNICALYPEWLASDDDQEFYAFEALVGRETERVKKLASRTFERGDRIIDFMYPDTD